MADEVLLCILIKALNEEKNISACLEAAIREASKLGGDVILVDSISSDRTVEIASTFAVKIVEFENIADRGCGAATQLGYQYAHGEFLYLIDGDMVLLPNFLSMAIEYLQNNPSAGGVGGLIIDLQENTPDDKRRANQYATIKKVISVDHLGGGALYRVSAIRSVGYIANRWLKACEEADLGFRLKCAGWNLIRLPVPAVTHRGHSESGLGMLQRIWCNRRMHAHGVFLRSALGRPWWWSTVRYVWFVYAAPVIYLAAFSVSLLLFHEGVNIVVALFLSTVISWFLVFMILSARKNSFTQATLSIVAWHLYPFAAAAGFFHKVNDPQEVIKSRVISDKGRGVCFQNRNIISNACD
jgi:GT2 family glycosyltransferase